MEIIIAVLIGFVIVLVFVINDIKFEKDIHKNNYEWLKEECLKKPNKKYVVMLDEQISNKEFDRLNEELKEYFAPDKPILIRDKTEIKEI